MNVLAVLVDLAVAVSSVLLIVGLVRARGGSGGSVHDLFEVAFLNGGPGRVVDTALTAMQTDGRLVIGGPGIVAVQRADARDPVERAVLQEHAMAPSGALHTLREAVMRHPAVQEIGDGLAARGLLAAPAASRTWRRWGITQGLVCVLAIPLTVVLTVVQSMNDYPAGDFSVPFVFKVLPALLVGFPVGLVCAAVARGRVTGAGRRAAEAYRTAHAYDPHPAHLVATHGLRALPDPVLQTQLITAARMRPTGQPRFSGSPSSSDSSAMFVVPAVWCAGTSPGNGGCGSSNDGGGGSGGGGGGCSSGSGCGSGSSCGGSSGSSCSSSSGSSCGGGSSCGSSS
ncbi:TIGR04222 domain-containing membrane protein [Streptomyces sp. NBC_01217]|uniref:TIGR04222 domain-containing membrane protein n=1 Tax=Streptomyces sp. NBC_01217 TaxID=2903779 RepID=UPI002E10DA32|nr:TIGR04222 domain-containing membrane protein [Streptomyces sp. NBC_01217]